jgi:hypothetical protein
MRCKLMKKNGNILFPEAYALTGSLSPEPEWASETCSLTSSHSESTILSRSNSSTKCADTARTGQSTANSKTSTTRTN